VVDDSLIEGYHRHRLLVSPGVTGLWQILGSARIPLNEMVKIDCLYGYPVNCGFGYRWGRLLPSGGRFAMKADASLLESVLEMVMDHVVILRLGEYSLVALGAGAGGSVEHIRQQATRAIDYYFAEKDAGRPEWPFPGFLRNQEASGDVELRLSLDDDLWTSLELEAERQQVSTDQLAQHAVLFFAADRDAGRLPEPGVPGARHR
jgi:hypothetical protein